MIQISDHRPAHHEVSYFISQCKNVRSYVILSKKLAVKMLKDQTEYVTTYQYTNEDIEKNIELSKKKNVVKNVGRDIARIQLEVQSAQSQLSEAIQQLEDAKKDVEDNNDDDNNDPESSSSIIRLTEAVSNAQILLEEKLRDQEYIAKADETRKRKLSQNSKVRNWMKVNAKATAANKKADLESYKQHKKNDNVNAEEAALGFNPFARRKAKPKNLWDASNKNEQEDKQQLESEGINSTSTSTKQKQQLESNKKKRIMSNNTPHLESHQFAIDEEMYYNKNGTSSSSIIQRVRKGLSFTEYLERKENGTL